MNAIGFDNDLYIRKQSEAIRERISKFGDKLYLEFGGKLFDDLHASRVLPGFKPDTKIGLLQEFRDQAEIIFCINAADIGKYLGILALAACAVVFVVGLLGGMDVMDIFMTAVSLAVSAIPFAPANCESETAPTSRAASASPARAASNTSLASKFLPRRVQAVSGFASSSFFMQRTTPVALEYCSRQPRLPQPQTAVSWGLTVMWPISPPAP